MKKFVEQFLLEIIDELYDMGYSLTGQEVNELHDQMITAIRNELKQ